MKQLAELIPIVLFFLAYQMDGRNIDIAGFNYHFDGLFSATLVLIIATGLQVVLTFLFTRKVDKRLLILFTVVAIFGSATLIFRNQAFIQWKPTVFNWVLAAVFFGSQFIGEKNLMERTLGKQIHLPSRIWGKLNSLWIGNFLVVGTLNIIVAYRFSEATWVSYKLYSSIGFTLLISIITVMIISPHIKEPTPDDKQSATQD